MDVKTLRETPPWDWPESAASTLLAALLDRSLADSERLAAAELAGDATVADEQVAGVLLDLVADSRESEALRAQAAISLGPMIEYADTMGGMDDDEVLSEDAYASVQSRLRALYEDDSIPDNVRRSVLEASVRGRLAWHPEAVEGAWKSDSEAWRLTATFCMRFVPGFEGRILSTLDDDNVEIRRQAILAAAAWETDAAWGFIEQILEGSEDKELVLAAIDAVAGIRPEEAEVLLAPLTESEDTDIASSAWEALSMLEGPETGQMSVYDELLN